MSSRVIVGSVGLAIVSLIAAGCGDDGPCQGAEGCACFPNGTCLDGLSCASNFCVDLDRDGGDRDGAADGPGSSSSSGAGRGGSSGGHAGTGGGHAGNAGGAGESGSRGDGGMAGGGGTIQQGDACDTSSECAALDDPCLAPVCISGKCDSASKPEGSPAPDDQSGDCERLVCDASGALASQSDGNDVPADDDDPCTIASCGGSTPTQLPPPA